MKTFIFLAASYIPKVLLVQMFKQISSSKPRHVMPSVYTIFYHWKQETHSSGNIAANKNP